MPRGLTDIHCHILPYVDDGSDDEDETRDLILGMLRQLQSRLEEVRHRQVTMQAELNTMIIGAEL
jgi:tyrosine-protein phosphatase YwqE